MQLGDLVEYTLHGLAGQAGYIIDEIQLRPGVRYYKVQFDEYTGWYPEQDLQHVQRTVVAQGEISVEMDF